MPCGPWELLAPAAAGDAATSTTIVGRLRRAAGRGESASKPTARRGMPLEAVTAPVAVGRRAAIARGKVRVPP